MAQQWAVTAQLGGAGEADASPAAGGGSSNCETSLVRSTGCARRAQDRNTCPGASALPVCLHPQQVCGCTKREAQSVPGEGQRAASSCDEEGSTKTKPGSLPSSTAGV